MSEREVMIELLVDVGVACQKAANKLSGGAVQVPHVVTEEEIEDLGLGDLNYKDASSVIRDMKSADELHAARKEEEDGKNRKKVLEEIKKRMQALSEDAKEEKEETKRDEESMKQREAKKAKVAKAFTVDNPAKGAKDIALFHRQFTELAGLQDDYLEGRIDSLGNSIESASSNDDEDFDDIEDAEIVQGRPYTAEELRTMLKDYAKRTSKTDARKILSDFGVKKIAELGEEQYFKFAERLK